MDRARYRVLLQCRLGQGPDRDFGRQPGDLSRHRPGQWDRRDDFGGKLALTTWGVR
jgi:hypothetical protein